MTELVVVDTAIRRDDDGRFSLNDLHRASGGQPKHRPSLWLANRQTRELLHEVELDAGIPALARTRAGARAGTFASEQLAVAYAAWISPRFHLNVIGTFLAAQRAARAAALLAPLEDPETLRGLLLVRAENEIALRGQLEQQGEQLKAFERLAGTRGGVSITAAAKALNLPPTALFAWLKDAGWIYRSGAHGNWLAYQARIDRGQMRHRAVTVERSDGTPRLVEQPLVTPKGLARLAELLERGEKLEQPHVDSPNASPAPGNGEATQR